MKKTRAIHSVFSHLESTLRGLLVQIGWFLNGTNLGINGLVSADRNNKATLPLTTPRCAIKSSAKDLSLRIVKLQFVSSTPGLLPGAGRQPAKVQGQRPIRIRLRCVGGNRPFLAWILT